MLNLFQHLIQSKDNLPAGRRSRNKFGMTRRKCMATPAVFLRETKDELKKVVWPTRQEVIRLTFVVIAVSLLVGLFLGGLDFIFVKIIGTVVK